jgi:hypothetical protein
LLVYGCRIPRIPIKQTLDYRGEFSVDGERVRLFRARDYAKLDTSNPILKYEYLPVDIYAVLDKNDSVKFYMVSTWQEYLWRFSERLSSVDKQYYSPAPLYLKSAGDTAVLTWGYPNIEGRDRDLRYVTRRRNDYWSVDYFRPGNSPDERYAGVIQSFPQYTSYTPFSRFTPGGPYQRAMEDSGFINRILRKELYRALGKDDPDSTHH